ncbi:hypothetical protein [Streptomyces prasinus]|uniref:hypothetical protein n=1 Tax=Streptomyces prasinus TaxID=67345 RepID=UPI002F428C9B
MPEPVDRAEADRGLVCVPQRFDLLAQLHSVTRRVRGSACRAWGDGCFGVPAADFAQVEPAPGELRA